MEGRKKEVFKNGLISAAKSTNALILTAGNNIGTMKLVGDAVGQGQFLVKEGNSFSRGLRLIGLTSWGYVKNNKDLLNLDPNELHNASYNSNVEILPRDNVPLNHDHTHFIFIDDGSRYRFFGKYSEFITKFESMVREAAPKVSNLLFGFLLFFPFSQSTSTRPCMCTCLVDLLFSFLGYHRGTLSDYLIYFSRSPYST